MNHDITHCKGDNCPKKETCHRYKAYLDIPNVKDRTLFSMVLVQGCIENNYNLYWEDKNDTL